MIAPMTPPPVLEVFYSPSCAPCRLELPVVTEFAKQDGARVRIVIVDQEALARRELRAASGQLETGAVTRTNAFPGATLREAGDRYAILPYARSLGGNATVCARWGGRLTVAKARELVAACPGSVTSPAPRRS